MIFGVVVAVAAVLVLVCYLLLIRPLEERIADRYRVLNEQRRTLGDDTQLLQRIADAETERTRLRAALHRYRLEDSPAMKAARFLEAASAAATRHEAIIGTVEAEPAAPPPTGVRPPLTELPFRCTLRGAYPALLATLRDVLGAPVAARIVLEALGPEATSHARPVRLVAALRVTVFGLPEPARVHAGSR